MEETRSYLKRRVQITPNFKHQHKPQQLLRDESALAGVAQWIECWPVNPKIAGSIPSQGTCLGCGPGPQQGAHERQLHVGISLPLFLPPFSSLK